MDIEQLEELITRLESAPDNQERQLLRAAIAPLVEFHHDVLRRVVDIVRGAHPATIDRLLEDDVVGPLLRGYELVPDGDLRSRVEAALEAARPMLRNHGGDVTFVEMRGRVAVLRLTGSCHGCASSLVTLERGIEQTLVSQVPDLRGVEVEGVTTPATGPGANWVPLVYWSDLHDGEWMKVRLFDEELLVCTIDERPFAFRNRCPAGGEGLEEGEFHHLSVACRAHGYHFDLRSGSCAERPELRLGVLPVMIDESVVKVAL